jgi:predicted N-acetyltransferase YhbS
MVSIRQEQAADYVEVYQLVKRSFATSSDSDGTEPDYLNEVRQQDTFIPELSLIAEDEKGKIVGQIVLYKTTITTADHTVTELLLSPICVHPDCFRRGIARSLMEKAFGIAKQMGYGAVFLCGNPDFYRKFGFRPTYELGIFHVDDKAKTAEWSMVRALTPGALDNISGTINTV